jgi:hypothetical protein
MEIKTWIKPALIVLVRSNPEEAVLSACKYGNPTGAGSANGGCFNSGCVITCKAMSGS